MASFEQKFRAYERDYPHHSSFVNFGRALTGQPLTRSRVVFYFKKLVHKQDYEKADYKEVLRWVCRNKGILATKHANRSIFAQPVF